MSSINMLVSADAIFIPLMKKKVDVLHPADLSDLNCYASIWCSIGNLWLAATAEGFGYNLRIPRGNEEEPAGKAIRPKQLIPDLEKQLHWQKF